MDEDVTRARGVGAEGRNAFKLLFARIVIMVSMCFSASMMLVWPLLDVLVAIEAGDPLGTSLVAGAVTVPASALLMLIARRRVDKRRDAGPWLFWGSLALTGAVFVLLQTPLYSLFALATWWGTAVLAAPRRRMVWITAALPVLTWFYALLLPSGTPVVGYVLMWLGAVLLALFATSSALASVWLWDITNDAVDGQRARARLAVTEERLRFSQDMDDLLGHSLSALEVKSDLAGRLLEHSPERAAAEMAQVQALARRSLQQVRSAVSGYREVSLVEEVASVSAVLRANRARVTVTGLDGLSLTPNQAVLAAWVVREGGTNVLRHSDATECRIAFTRTGDTAAGPETLVVEVSNDRAHGGGGEGAAFGNGLAGLSERVTLGGGTLSAANTGGGGFLLRAFLPLADRGAGAPRPDDPSTTEELR